MNEYFCGECCQSTYSAATFKNHKCPYCQGNTITNAKKEVKEHLTKFRKVTSLTNHKEE